MTWNRVETQHYTKPKTSLIAKVLPNVSLNTFTEQLLTLKICYHINLNYVQVCFFELWALNLKKKFETDFLRNCIILVFDVSYFTCLLKNRVHLRVLNNLYTPIVQKYSQSKQRKINLLLLGGNKFLTLIMKCYIYKSI